MNSFGSNDNQTNGLTREEFINEINEKLTVNGSIPFKLPIKAVEDIIKTALDYFYRKYPDALEPQYFVIYKHFVNSEEFKINRRVQLPRQVYSVDDVQKIGNSSLFSGDFSVYKSIGQSYNSSKAKGYDIADNTIEWLSQKSLFSLLSDTLTNEVVGFNFNRLNKKLFITGETPNKDLLVITQVKIDEEYLFEDDYFKAYVVGLAKISLAKIFRFFRIPLPGNVEIDFEGLASEGKEEIDEIKQNIQEEEGMADYMFMSDTN